MTGVGNRSQGICLESKILDICSIKKLHQSRLRWRYGDNDKSTFDLAADPGSRLYDSAAKAASGAHER